MNIVTLKAEPREVGKKGARDSRKGGAVPCVLYGHGADNVHFQVADLDMHKLVFTGGLHRLKVEMGKDSYDCILRDVDFDPIRNVPIHADFQMLRVGEKIELDVPVKFVGKAKGQMLGGEVQYIIHDLHVACLPKDIPEHVEVDITELEIGDTVHVSDLSFEDLEILSPPQQSVVAVTAKRAEEVVEEEELAEGVEGEPAAEGEQPAEGETASEQ